jgi:copper(I)-binding protein
MLGSCNQQVAAVSDDANVLQYEDAWIREAPPGMSMMAGYLNIRNNGDKDVAIVSATSDAFMDIEMHKTEITDKTARMIEQERLLIPKGGEMELSPGGFHLMLMMPIEPLKEGDKVDVKFKQGAGLVDKVEFEVLKASGDGSKH